MPSRAFLRRPVAGPLCARRCPLRPQWLLPVRLPTPSPPSPQPAPSPSPQPALSPRTLTQTHHPPPPSATFPPTKPSPNALLPFTDTGKKTPEKSETLTERSGSASASARLGSTPKRRGSARLQKGSAPVRLGSALGDLLCFSDHVDPILLFLLLFSSCTSLVVFPHLIMWDLAVIFPETCLKLISNFISLLGFLIVAYIASLCLASYTRVRDSTLLWYHRSHWWYFTTQPLHGCPLDFFKSNRGFLILLVTLALLGILTGFEIRTLFHAMSREMNNHISHFQLSHPVLARYFCLAAAPSMLGDLEAFLQTVQVRTDSFTSISIDLLPQQASSNESFWRHFSVIVLKLDLCCFYRRFPFACRCCNRYYYN